MKIYYEIVKYEPFESVHISLETDVIKGNDVRKERL